MEKKRLFLLRSVCRFVSSFISIFEPWQQDDGDDKRSMQTLIGFCKTALSQFVAKLKASHFGYIQFAPFVSFAPSAPPVESLRHPQTFASVYCVCMESTRANDLLRFWCESSIMTSRGRNKQTQPGLSEAFCEPRKLCKVAPRCGWPSKQTVAFNRACKWTLNQTRWIKIKKVRRRAENLGGRADEKDSSETRRETEGFAWELSVSS